MNQSRHWAAWMATLLILLGLAILPREGAAWSRYTDPIDPVLFGEPDEPIHRSAYTTDFGRASPAPAFYVSVVSIADGTQVFSIRLPTWFALGVMQWSNRSSITPRMRAWDSAR